MAVVCNTFVLAIAIAFLNTPVDPSEHRGGRWGNPSPNSGKERTRGSTSSRGGSACDPIKELSGSTDNSASARSMDSFPDEVILEIFKRAPPSSLRNAVPGMNRRLRDLAYLDEFRPTELKLNYDSEHPNKKCSYLADPGQRIDFDVIKTLEISIKGDANCYGELYKFTDRKDIEFLELESLKIDMEWTSSNYMLVALSKLFRKTRKLKRFSLELKDMFVRERTTSHDKLSRSKKFWNALKESKPEEVEFTVAEQKGYRNARHIALLANFEFANALFALNRPYLKNLIKLTVEWNASYAICEFVERSIQESYDTIKEINVEFACLIDWKYDSPGIYNLERDLPMCKNLERLFVNFALIEHGARNLSGYAICTWTALTGIVDEAPKEIYFGLKTNTNYLFVHGFLEAFDANLEKKLSTKYLKLIVNSSARDYKSEVATVLNICPQLESLQIVYDFENDVNVDAIRHVFEWVGALNELKELAISYQQPRADHTNIYRELQDLAMSSSGITKITVKVASSVYQLAIGKSEEIEESHRENVKVHILNDSDKINLKKLFENSFKVESKLATTRYEDDSHLLILKKIRNRVIRRNPSYK